MDDLFGEVISTYTAEQAVEDGMLADVTMLAKEVGFKLPVRITSTVSDLCTPPESNKIQSYEGRLWDVLNLAKWAILRAKDDNFTKFTVKLGRKNHELWAMLDFTSGPAIHIMVPSDY
jgi:hypothetical protein